MNEIIQRVYDFLKEYPPFHYLAKDELMLLSGRVMVKYFAKGEYIYKAGDNVHQTFYIINQGGVNLINERANLLADQCDEGDVFGVRPLLIQTPYIFSAQASEDSLLYAIDNALFRTFLEKYSQVALYISSVYANSIDFKGSIHSAEKGTDFFDPSLSGIEQLKDLRPPSNIHKDSTIIAAAAKMDQLGVNYLIVVNTNGLPEGIITDKDFRSRVVAGNLDKESPVSAMMTSPVYTQSKNISIAELQIQMIRRKIGHVLITEDGTPNSKPVGGVTLQDIILAENNNPTIIVKEIRKAQNPDDLKKARENAEKLLEFYLSRDISMDYLSEIMSEINDQIIVASINMSIAELSSEYQYNEDRFVWVSLGSEGRKEQLLRTDQDSALIYLEEENIEDKTLKEKYLKLAVKVVSKLEHVGFERCPADMMAANPDWCMPLHQWEETFKNWMKTAGNEAILHTSIFLDYRRVAGNKSIADALTQSIFTNLEKSSIFLHNLAKGALENPSPLTFFRNFIVERNGEHKDAFDIKQRAMLPLTDAARVMILEKKIGNINNTPERFRKLATLDVHNKELLLLAADAYEILMRLRAKNGVKRKNNGRYIYPHELDKFERTLLRNCFDPINELQLILKVRFNLGGIF
jgi:CBS domain-containing protein